jgi:hypothetical protein
MDAKRQGKKGKGKEKPSHCRQDNMRAAEEYTDITKTVKPSKATNNPQQPELPDIPALISYGEQDEGAQQPRGKCRKYRRKDSVGFSWYQHFFFNPLSFGHSCPILSSGRSYRILGGKIKGIIALYSPAHDL